MMIHSGFRIDLHVHTKRYSPCAELLDPDRLGETIGQLGLAGVVITEHDRLWRKEDIAALKADSKQIKIYRGIEISSSLGHLVVIGLDDLDGIHPGIQAQDVIAKAKTCAAAVILVHHHLIYPSMNGRFEIHACPPGIDAIEIASTMTSGENRQAAVQIAKTMGWCQVAGSDAHSLENVGKAFTVFPHLPENETQLAKAIRNGSGIPLTIEA